MANNFHLHQRIVVDLAARFARIGLCLVIASIAFENSMADDQVPATAPGPDTSLNTPPGTAAEQAHPGAPTIPPGVEVQRDIVYVNRGNHAMKLDLYSPSGSGSARPLAIWMHGGGWRMGSRKTWVNPLFLATHGYAVVSLEYRLSGEAPFPAQIEDCKAAVRFLRANAATYNLDPKRFAAIGESAGGNLASLLGTTGGTKDLTDAPDSPDSDQVQAVIDLFGPADLTQLGEWPAEEKPNTVFLFAHKLIGHTLEERPDLYQAASPVYHISSTTVPFLILHGEKDPVVPVAQSQELVAALQKAGISSELIVVPVSYHAGPAFWTEEKQQRMISFLQKALQLPSAPGVAETIQGKSEK